MNDNPYSPPQSISNRAASGVHPVVGATCFWLAMTFTGIGFASLFIRNSPPGGWLLLGLALFMTAIVLSRGRYRIASIFGLAICILVFGGTVLEYRHKQRVRQLQQQLKQMGDAASQRQAELSELKATKTETGHQEPKHDPRGQAETDG